MSVAYGLSSTFQHWMCHSKEQLETRRRLTRSRIIDALTEAAAAKAGEGNTADSMGLKPLAMDDEALLRAHWERKLQMVCESKNLRDPARFTTRVLAAAQIYFKRFFLAVSLMEESPLGVMLAALYLAGKVEEERIEVEELIELSGRKLTKEALLNLEMRLLKTLQFQLVIRSPFRCLAGLIQDLHEFLSGGSGRRIVTPSALKDLQRESTTSICGVLCTEAPLLFPPHLLALWSVRKAASKVSVDVEPWVEHRLHEGVPGGVGLAPDSPAALICLEKLVKESVIEVMDMTSDETKQRLKRADAHARQLQSVTNDAILCDTKERKNDSQPQKKTSELESGSKTELAFGKRHECGGDSSHDTSADSRDSVALDVKKLPTAPHIQRKRSLSADIAADTEASVRVKREEGLGQLKNES